jgi:hypothetical protein
MVDRDLLGQLMAEFELNAERAWNDTNQWEDNPFMGDSLNADVLDQLSAFTGGNTVKRTDSWMPTHRPPWAAALAYSTAGFLQGLVIGWEYHERQSNKEEESA